MLCSRHYPRSEQDQYQHNGYHYGHWPEVQQLHPILLGHLVLFPLLHYLNLLSNLSRYSWHHSFISNFCGMISASLYPNPKQMCWNLSANLSGLIKASSPYDVYPSRYSPRLYDSVISSNISCTDLVCMATVIMLSPFLMLL